MDDFLQIEMSLHIVGLLFSHWSESPYSEMIVVHGDESLYVGILVFSWDDSPNSGMIVFTLG